ncbi:MAG TPA: hypothetical protein VMN57_05665 [Anaerolineales bacterium]|nr:hypothetical protein [Anaerolineales bacterium]
MKRIIPVMTILVLLLLVPAMTASAAGFVTPTFTIDSVDKDVSVTITTKNFPANDTFTVTMGEMGTKGVGGIVVTSQASGAGGSFTATYAIPDALKGRKLIAIRLQSPTSGYYSYNWFYNNTVGTNPPPPDPAPPPFTIPTFKIDAVVKNDTVTITTANFPANDSFVVTMGYMGTRGVNGFVVVNQDSGAGGSFTATYEIPEQLRNLYQISIRLQSPTSGYYSFNWFYNNSTP